MSELIIENVKNLEQPKVKELLDKFKNRNNINVVDVAEIISNLISILSLDHDSGRPKQYSISGGHLGQILGIGKGVVSQFLSVWNMPQESKEFLRNYNLSLINAYQVSRIKGKDETESIKLQKDMILQKSSAQGSGESGRKLDVLLHTISEAELILGSIVNSYKIPREILQDVPKKDTDSKESLNYVEEKAEVYIENITKCINYISPKISRLSFLKKEFEFCIVMLESGENKFCGVEITNECLHKQIESIKLEIDSIEEEKKLPHISSLIMMKNNLEKYI